MMHDILQNYVNSIASKFSYEETSEMGYRTDFEILLKGLFESINVTRFDHDAKSNQGNKPDFVVRKNNIPILYIEAKDIGVSLDKVEKSEQMSRYFGYANLVLTDYVEFRFYRNGLPYGEPIKIADYDKNSRVITQIVNNFDYLAKTFIDFTQSHKEPIRSGKHLAKIMGGKAQRIRDNVRQFLNIKSEKNAELFRIYETIKKLLVHDLGEDTFADMYAQTLVYGLFVARFYDKTQSSFSRQEARDLIPKSNPLLRHFFDHIVGPDFDKRLEYIVNELCEVFSHADVEKLMRDYYQEDLWGKEHRGPDPVIHFYEDFLKEYDSGLRKKMGAYYTPLPVVNFIVRSVDSLLKATFNLSGGLADTTKLPNGKHRVQILDPAVGTGTFISAVIRSIYADLLKRGQKGQWPTYVHNELLPRIHGFELMMTPYTIAHLKLGMAFGETGFKYFNRRLGIYLTNSLEKAPDQGSLFTAFGLAESIADESKEASVIKNEVPIMVVVGNPPYSGISSNETEYANSLIEQYKVEPGGKQKLQERKHWLNDDYVKFIALAENMIKKTGDGIVAMITNNGYLDNPTFRGMRWHIANTFDEIYILDLHGSTKKNERSPDGSKDENVFDIMQGVGIILAVKTGKKASGQLARVFHADLYGTRNHKFDELTKTPEWKEITLDSRMVYFVPKNVTGQSDYEKGVKVNDLFVQNVTGVVTARDDVVVDISKEELMKRMEHFADFQYSDIEIRNWLFSNKKSGKYDLGDSRGWKLPNARRIVREQNISEIIEQIEYRPFDRRYIYYDKSMVDWGRFNYMKQFIKRQNIGLDVCRQVISSEFSHVFLTKHIVDDSYVSNKSRERGYVFPLYIYQDDGTRNPNFNQESLKEFTKNIQVTYEPEEVLDYIYAVLYSPNYRKKYREFLKLDFPRVPSPKNSDTFKKLVVLGRELRQLHLLESPKVNEFITTYPEVGLDTVENLVYKDGKVFINDKQYFGGVPNFAWEFYIGGYQPAQKWLKDRLGKKLVNSDIDHYQKIIVSLTETNRIMKEINKILENI